MTHIAKAGSENYVREMEALIFNLLGNLRVKQIMVLAHCSQEEAEKMTIFKDMVKLTYLIRSRNLVRLSDQTSSIVELSPLKSHMG